MECHNITDYNGDFFLNNKVKSCIALTATLPNSSKMRLLEQFKLPVVYSISLDDAVKLRVITPYNIYVIRVPLDDKTKYVKAGNKAKPFYQTELNNYNYLNRRILEDETQGKSSKNARINRMRFIYNLKSKTNAALNLLNHIIPNYIRTLIFCGSKEQADQVCPCRFYSKPTKPKMPKVVKEMTENKNGVDLTTLEKLNEYKIYNEALANYSNDILYYRGSLDLNKFISQEILQLSCVAALNEGHNIPNLDCLFIVQADAQALSITQRIGRGVRYRPGVIAKVIILCSKDTVDEEWIRKATARFDQNNIKWLELDNLRTNKEKIF